MSKSIPLAVPKDRTGQGVAALRDYEAWTRVMLKDTAFTGPEVVFWAADRQGMIVFGQAPVGENDAGIEHSTLLEAIMRTTLIRSRRRNAAGILTPVQTDWWPKVRGPFAPLFDDCPRQQVGDGRIDITLALADWLWPDSENGTLRIEKFVDRDGEIYADSQGYDNRMHGILGAFEMMSAHVCDTCGAPGKTYVRGEPLSPVTKCHEHKPETEE